MGQLSHNVNEDESERTYSNPHAHNHNIQQKYGLTLQKIIDR